MTGFAVPMSHSEGHPVTRYTEVLWKCSLEKEEVADRKGTRFPNTKGRMGWGSSLGIEHVPSIYRVLDQSSAFISLSCKNWT